MAATVDPAAVAGAGASGAAAPPPTETAPAPESINFDFGDGESYEGKFDSGGETQKPEKPTEWDKTLDEKYRDNEELSPIIKSFKDTHFREKAWRESGFESPRAAKEYRGQVDQLASELGRGDGLTGLDAIRAEMQEWATVYAGLASGDVGVAQGFFRENPESLGTITPALLSEWHAADADGYSSSMAKIIMATLSLPDQQSGVTVLGALNQLYDSIGDNPAAKRWLDIIGARMQGLKDVADRKPEQKAPDYTAREKELAGRERDIALRSYQNSAETVVSAGVRQAAKALLGNRQVSDAQMSSIESRIREAFFKSQTGDAEYQRNLRDVLESGDETRILRLVKSKIARSMPQAARSVIREMTSLGDKPQPKAEAAPGGARTATKLAKWTGDKAPNGGPAPGVIDTRRTTDDMLEQGKFYVWGDPETVYTW